MNVSFAAQTASMRPEVFWEEIDARLENAGQPNAIWTEELASLYAQGVSVPVAFRCVLAGRKVRP